MKKQFIFILFIFLSVTLSGQVSKTVNITAGNLWSAVTVSEKAVITDLTITGTMDSRDFTQLKDSFPALTSINLDNVSVSAYNGAGANTIPASAFTGRTLLKTCVLPKNLTTVGANAFNGCVNITAIHFPSTLSAIDVTSFQNFGGLFTVDAGSATFSANGGILYNKTQTDLIQSPVSITGAVTLSPAVTTIKTYAFYNCNKIADIVSSNSGALTIETMAFNGCSVTSFTTNATLTTINERAFESASKLITFKANNIDVGSRSFLSCTSLVTVDASVVNLNSLSFYNCSRLTGITLVAPISIIPDNAFAGCQALLSIVLPTSVTTIAGSAFSNCSKMTTVTGASVALGGGAFYGCTSLVSVNATLTAIGNNAFYGCSKLKDIQVSSSLTSIGSLAFYGCTVLNSFTIPAAVTSIGDGAFRYCNGPLVVNAANTKYSSQGGVLFDKSATTLIQSPVSNSNIYSVPDGVVTIKSYSFFNNSLLNTINLSKTVCNIESAAFLNCPAKINIASDNPCYYTSDGLVIFNADSTKLIFCSPKKSGSYTLPNSVIEISDFAFAGCNLLTSVTMNNGLKTIGANAFDGSTINAIVIPPTVTSLGVSAFANCAKATSIVVPPSLTSISNYAFSGCRGAVTVSLPSNLSSIGEYSFSGCAAWKGKLILPMAITAIGKYAFNGCTALTDTLNIPPIITSVSEAAFANCTGFTYVNFPPSVKSIGGSAFYGCKGLKKVTIPETVDQIGGSAFLNCTGLTSFYADDAQPIDLSASTNVFYGINKRTCTLFVPAGSKKLYQKAANWKDFYHIIEGLGFWIDKDTLFISDKIKTDSVIVGSNTTWKTQVISNTPWLTSSPVEGKLDGYIYVSVIENLGDRRIGEIGVSSQDSKDTLVVVQLATSEIPNIEITSKALNQCGHQSYTFTAVRKTAPAGTFTYDWDFGDGTTESSTKNTITHEFVNQRNTTYNMVLKVSSGGYYRTFAYKFVTNDLPELILDNKPSMCEGDSMVVHVKGAEKYIWSNGSMLDSIIIKNAGEYNVQGIKNDTLCSSVTFTVTYFEAFDYAINVDNNEIKSYIPLVHMWTDDVPGSQYEWLFSDGGRAEGKEVSYIFKSSEESFQKITLNATNPNGCVQKFEKYIRLIHSEMPNTFTPNGDGKNDIFMKDYQMKVFDRAGQLLYSGNEGWDGTYKGNKMPKDTYYFVIEVKTQNETKVVSNYVMLVR